jgi:hypothetical protein
MEDAERARLQVRVARLEQQIRAFKELHANELGLILGELESLRADLAPRVVAEAPGAPQKSDAADLAARTDADPAASSPKRAAWLAEQERKERERREPLSRRDLLRGRERDGGGS